MINMISWVSILFTAGGSFCIGLVFGLWAERKPKPRPEPKQKWEHKKWEHKKWKRNRRGK